MEWLDTDSLVNEWEERQPSPDLTTDLQYIVSDWAKQKKIKKKKINVTAWCNPVPISQMWNHSCTLLFLIVCLFAAQSPSIQLATEKSDRFLHTISKQLWLSQNSQNGFCPKKMEYNLSFFLSSTGDSKWLGQDHSISPLQRILFSVSCCRLSQNLLWVYVESFLKQRPNPNRNPLFTSFVGRNATRGQMGQSQNPSLP